ncbi:MAG: ABC transporter ATP-binding protein [Bdellovibrionaceae bacterium]|nr:ABC transporter ATP-binding protein [Pseudobdellovibrionaceae bacterium]
MRSSRSSLLFDVVFHRWAWKLLILSISFFSALTGLLAPWFQKEFIDRLTGAETPLRLDWVESPVAWITLAFLAMILGQAAGQLTNYLGAREAIFLQRIFAKKLHSKMMNLKVDTMSRQSLGEVVSLYATDVPGATVFLDQTLPAGASTLFPLILAPFALSLFFNVPLWPTVSVIVLVGTINSLLAFRQSRFFYRFKQLAAERTGLVNEWIQNIRTLRILGWTASFERFIFEKREVETENRVSMVTNGQIMNTVATSVTFFLNIVTLGTLVVWYKQALSPGEVFALLWILGVFLTRPFRQMPWFFTFAFDAWTSLTRLQRFLDTPNHTTPASHPSGPEKTSPDIAVDVDNLNLVVGGKHLLKNIRFSMNKGEFVAIVGEVGSGKTLLLLSLLRETGASFGRYRLHQQDALHLDDHALRSFYAFAPQEGFIMSATLRDNVSFHYGTTPDQDPEILRSLVAAQFRLDRERVEDGLETEIGERGVNLSGGQRQRVGLARVHHANAPILLLDDCLSAVDVETEERLLEELFEHEWQNRTKLLVTHRLTVLDKVDRILFLKDGEIKAQGSFEELQESSADFREFTQSVSRLDKGSPAIPVKVSPAPTDEAPLTPLVTSEVTDGD